MRETPDGAIGGPIRYSIDDARGVIVEVWKGIVRADDLRRYWLAYLADPKVLALRRTIVDLREADIRFTGAELRELVTSVVVPALRGATWMTAIVVGHPVQLGVSRQYQVFAESYSTDTVFADYDSALAWILR